LNASSAAGHIVLLGDSIFDNGVYVPGAPDVVRQLRSLLADGWKATLLAIDGAVVRDVARQLARLPSDATLLVVSVGGNDALGEAHLLSRRTSTIGEGMQVLADARRRFAERYEEMLDAVVACGRPAAACTIYDGDFPAPEGEVISAALSLFNDSITRAAFARNLPLIDLRLIFSEQADYANPIEPSEQGGAKIAAAIARLAASGGDGAGSVVIAAR